MVSMMVDSEGKTYDVTAVDSSGNSAFEKSAIAVAEKWTFEPAEFGGRKILASHRHRIAFELTATADGAARHFVRRYRAVNEAIVKNDKDKAEKGLQRLDSLSRSLYEQAYWQLARFQYERKWGTDADSYRALNRAAYLYTAPEVTMDTFIARHGLFHRTRRSTL